MAMFPFIYLQSISQKVCGHVYHFRTKFNIPTSNGSLIISIRPEVMKEPSHGLRFNI